MALDATPTPKFKVRPTTRAAERAATGLQVGFKSAGARPAGLLGPCLLSGGMLAPSALGFKLVKPCSSLRAPRSLPHFNNKKGSQAASGRRGRRVGWPCIFAT